MSQGAIPSPVAAMATPGRSAIAVDRALLAVLCLALVLRLLVFAFGPACQIDRAYLPDSHRYVALAENLLATGTFALNYEDASTVHGPMMALRDRTGHSEPRSPAGHRPEVFRSPGYPAFIAALLALGLPLASVVVAQVLLSTASVGLIYALGRDLLNSRAVATAAAATVAIHPADIDAANTLLSETVFTFTILLGLWLAVRCTRPTHAAGAGMVLGLSALIRPVSFLLGLAAAVWMAATPRRRPRLAVLLLIASLIAPGLWVWRNASLGFGPSLSPVAAHNAWFYTVAYMRIGDRGGDTALDWPAATRELVAELERERLPGEDPYDAAQRLASAEIRDHPTAYAATIARSMVKLFTDHSMNSLCLRFGHEWKPTGLRAQLASGNLDLRATDPLVLLAAAWMALNTGLLVAMFAGLLVLALQRRWPALLLLAGVIAYFSLATQAVGLERFRLPFLGLQALAAASILLMPLGRQFANCLLFRGGAGTGSENGS